MSEDAPRYKHDCSNCMFLGNFILDITYDLYVCSAGKNISTVVARYSSDGPDYLSGLEFALLYEKGINSNGVTYKNTESFISPTGRILYEALKRAEKKGFKIHSEFIKNLDGNFVKRS